MKLREFNDKRGAVYAIVSILVFIITGSFIGWWSLVLIPVFVVADLLLFPKKGEH